MPAAIMNRYLFRMFERLIESFQAGVDTARTFPVISSLHEPELVEDRHIRDLAPGCWRYSLHGFCMGIGRAEPVRGSLYEVARIHERSDLGRVLRGLADHPEISREDGQRLVWSLRSRTPLAKLPADQRQVAEQVYPGITRRSGVRNFLLRMLQGLISRVIFRLERYLPSGMVNLARSVRNVSTRIRTNLPYRDLERLAMAALPDDLKRDAREQWLMSSDGYYIKLLPNNYRSAEMLVRVPPRLGTTITRDEAGRIVEVSQDDGVSVRWVYGEPDTIQLDDNRTLPVWQLRQVELTGDNQTYTIDSPGWVARDIKELAGLDLSRYPNLQELIRSAQCLSRDNSVIRKFIGRSGNTDIVTDVLMSIHLLAALRAFYSSRHLAKTGTGFTGIVAEAVLVKLLHRLMDGLAARLLESMDLPCQTKFVPEEIIGLPGDLRQQRMGLRFGGNGRDGEDEDEEGEDDGGDDPRCGEGLSWSDVDGLFSRAREARVTDVRTGMSFNVRRWGGRLHADVEPATAADTRTLREIYGGEFSWERRPIVVTVNGRQIAGSMHGMPHGGQSINDNNYDGHHCLHFRDSSTHKTGRPDDGHQAAVEEATCR